MEISELLNITINRGASDLHLLVGKPPVLRIHGELTSLPNFPTLEKEEAQNLIFSLLNSEQKETFLANREIDLSFPFRGDIYNEQARFRVNIYYQKDTIAASLRYIPAKVRDFQELNLPSSLIEFSKLHQGFVLVTGPAGMGKTTTIATLINEINKSRNCHIITIEDPIEYVYPQGKALISQREMRSDTYSWEVALRSVLREDPDVVLIGEMRDYETIASALTVAETGHLVFATLHTNSASQTIDRIVDVFPPHQQGQIKMQLSATLAGIISQRLVPSLDGGRLPVLEILIGTPAVRTTIREGKTHLVDNIIQTSKDIGMISLEESLADLVSAGKISLEQAKTFALRPEEVRRFLKKS